MKKIDGLWFLIVLFVVAVDQFSKSLAMQYLTLSQSVEVTSFFNLTLSYNNGAAFSFLHQSGGWQRWFLSGVAMIVCIIILVWFYRERRSPKRLVKWALMLILGGALGNLFDRLSLGYVIDFLDFHWYDWHFAAFNLADSAITLGAGLLFLDIFIDEKAMKRLENKQ